MTTPKQSPKPADDVAAMVERQKARRESVYDYATQGAEWQKDELCQEAAALLTRLEAERDGYRDRAHYAEGTASLAIQHRDAAEKRIAELEAERDGARRKLFPHADANPICGLSYKGFYFISDQKGIKELRCLENNANQIETWKRSFDENLAAYKARVEAAEKRNAELEERLGEAMEMLRTISKINRTRDQLQAIADGFLATLKEKNDE